jgi:hypothetical protein
MIYIGLHAFLPPQGIYYTPPALRHTGVPMVANPPFNADAAPLDAPTSPGKTRPAVAIIEQLSKAVSHD